MNKFYFMFFVVLFHVSHLQTMRRISGAAATVAQPTARRGFLNCKHCFACDEGGFCLDDFARKLLVFGLISSAMRFGYQYKNSEK